MTSKFKEAAEKYASDNDGMWTRNYRAFLTGAEHGYGEGHIDSDTQWSEKVLALEAENIKLRQQLAERNKEIERMRKVNAHYINKYGDAETEWFKTREALKAEVERERERRAKLREVLIEAMAELIYLRLYGKDGAIWFSNDAKDVWRDKARQALAAAKQDEGNG